MALNHNFPADVRDAVATKKTGIIKLNDMVQIEFKDGKAVGLKHDGKWKRFTIGALALVGGPLALSALGALGGSAAASAATSGTAATAPALGAGSAAATAGSAAAGGSGIWQALKIGAPITGQLGSTYMQQKAQKEADALQQKNYEDQVKRENEMFDREMNERAVDRFEANRRYQQGYNDEEPYRELGRAALGGIGQGIGANLSSLSRPPAPRQELQYASPTGYGTPTSLSALSNPTGSPSGLTAQGGGILLQGPDGERRYFPPDQAEALIQRGAKRIEEGRA